MAEEVPSPALLDATARAQELANIRSANERDGRSWTDTARDIVGETLTASLLTPKPRFEPDPTFTLDRYKERYKAAQDLLPEDMWSDLEGARSEKEFDWLLGRAQGHITAQRRIAEAGWDAAGANLLAQFLDPASLAIGIGTGSLAIKAARLAQLTRRGQIAANALGGGVGGLATVGVMDQQGMPVTQTEYVMATGLGLALGAAFGPLSRNPALAREAGVILKAGEDLQQAAEVAAQAPVAPPAPVPQAAVKRAEVAAREAPDKAVAEPAPLEVRPQPKPAATHEPTIGDAAEAAIKETPLAEALPEGTVKQAVDALVPTPKAPKPADPTTQPGLASRKPEEAAAKVQQIDDETATAEIELSPALKKNPKNIAEFVTFDGDEYRIVSIGDDATGPYKVVQNGSKTVASNLETLAEARSRIPGLPGSKSAQAAPAEELQPIAAAPDAPRAQVTGTGPADELFAIPEDHTAQAQFDAALAKIGKLPKKDIDALLNDYRNRPTNGTFKWKSKNKGEALKQIRDTWIERVAAHDKHEVIERLTSWTNKDGAAALAEAKPLPGKLGEEPAGYTFRGIRYMKESDDGNETFYSVWKGDKQIGELEIGTQDGRRLVTWSKIEPEYQHSPAAHGGMLVAAKHGAPWLPDGKLSKDSFPMWSKRLPWVREFYREDPKKPGSGDMLSPKRILQDYETIKDNPELARRYQKTIDSLPPEALEHDNLARMFAAKSTLNVVSKPAVRAEIEDVLNRILPREVKKVLDDDRTGYLDGYYRDRTVFVAMNADNPLNIAYHETTHALRQTGLLTDKEWNKLSAWAKKSGAREKYGIDKRYAGESAEALDEEAVAHALADRLAGNATGDAVADTILDKVINVLRAIRDALGIRGFRTVRDIFDDIDNGVIAQRPMAGDLNDAAFMAARREESVGAQRNTATSEDFLQDMDWKSIQDDATPRAGGFWRFDRAGMIGHSENAPGRLVGAALLNDSVGKAGHSLNPFSADQDYRRILAVWMSEYDRTARPAFQEWADDLRLSPTARWTREHEFFEEVGRYVRNRDREPGEYHPAVERLGNKVAAVQAEILEDLKNPLRREGLTGRPISGAELTPEDANYLWRKFDHAKVRGAIDDFGQTGVTKMVANAIRSAQPEIDEAVLAKLAQGYVRNIHNRAVGLGDEWSLALGERDAERFRRLIMQEARLTDDEADAIVNRLFEGERTEAGQMPNLKRRVLLDETYVERGIVNKFGETADLAFADLIDSNVNNLVTHYARRAAGRVALGRVRIAHHDGTMLVNGINTDAEWTNILDMVQRWGIDRGQHDSAKTVVERLQFAYDRIKGVPDPAQMTQPAQWMRLIRAYMSTRLMGQVGVAQLGETGTAVGALGVRAAFAHIPGFRRVIDAAGDTRLRSQLFDELEVMGIGAERLHGLHFHNLDEVGELPFAVAQKPRLERALHVGRLAERATYEASGMSVIAQQQQRMVAAGMAQRIANMAERIQSGKGLSRGDLRRLAQLDIDEARLTRILDQMKTHADTTEGAFFGRRLNRLNVQNWDDLEARAWLENSLWRSAHKFIQSGDEGSAAFWMSNPIAQTIFQFRGFPFTAWANQLQYNVHMGDARAAMTFLWSTAWAAAVRGAQLQLIAASRSDKERFLEEKMTPWELGKAGFERSGWSSIIPMGVDTGLAFVGQPGMFNARSTGQASSIFGSPAVSFLDSSAKGMGGMVNSVTGGRSPSQAEVRAAFGMLPFQNLMPISSALSYLIHDLPERAPPETRKGR
jgi:hypothetical protein